MGRKILPGVKVGHSWTSYISAADGVLRGANFWDEPVGKLLGMTGLGFHFIIHRQLCPSSVTVYDWLGEHFAALDRIGIFSEVYETSLNQDRNTLSIIRSTAVNRIKEAIDGGVGVIVWCPTTLLEFGIIRGYDEEDRVFFVTDCCGQEADPLLFANLGKSEIPLLFYQIIKEKVPLEPEKIYRSSLDFGVREWRKPFHIHPDYASGFRGYQNLVAALENGDFDEFGLAYILAVYGDAKNDMAKYLSFLTEQVPALQGLEPAAGISRQVAALYQKATRLIPFSGKNGSGCAVDRAAIPETLRLMKEAWQLEETMFCEIERVLGAWRG